MSATKMFTPRGAQGSGAASSSNVWNASTSLSISNGFFFNGALRYDGVPFSPGGQVRDSKSRPWLGWARRGCSTRSMTGSAENLKSVLWKSTGRRLDWKPKDYFMTVRLIVTGRKDSPPLQ